MPKKNTKANLCAAKSHMLKAFDEIALTGRSHPSMKHLVKAMKSLPACK